MKIILTIIVLIVAGGYVFGYIKAFGTDETWHTKRAMGYRALLVIMVWVWAAIVAKT